MKTLLRAVLFASLGVLASLPARAQDDSQRLREQLRQTVLQLRALQDSQAALQAQAAAATQERDALRAELAKLQGTARSAEAQRSELEGGLAKYRAAFGQASQQAQQTEAARAQTQSQLDAATARLDFCAAKNLKLLAVAREILKAYAEFDLGDAIGANEPFLQLKRVELENLAQGYSDAVYDGRYDPNAPPPPRPAQAPAAQPAPANSNSSQN